MIFINIALVLGAAYLAGSVHFGLLAGKVAGINIREGGSGNVGTTNVFRLMGWRWGVLVFILDTAKGYLPVLLVLRFTGSPTLTVLSAGAAILGHTFSVWLRFKGGKGVATGLGTIIALTLPLALLAFLIFGLVLAVGRIVSVASLTAIGALWIAILATKQPLAYVTFVTMGAVLITYAHRSNIRRLFKGTENRIGGK
ncbi:glycerol-3-phosphate 1-O-acyltransferase [candidate division WS5 bacterium]|uniref:Glycerol-3-phosphate acyltransferase n=1 Tax=candidate division WS5 bacterium TaxID=2093353 RepID=A0A419DA17_9BACT|nr:MAG: glycerol-3-phosphate 1-O-acyltransferase [candidate division WS5 bacterium]